MPSKGNIEVEGHLPLGIDLERQKNHRAKGVAELCQEGEGRGNQELEGAIDRLKIRQSK